MKLHNIINGLTKCSADVVGGDVGIAHYIFDLRKCGKF